MSDRITASALAMHYMSEKGVVLFPSTGTKGWLEQIREDGNMYDPDNYGVTMAKAIEKDWGKESIERNWDELMWHSSGCHTFDIEWSEL